MYFYSDISRDLRKIGLRDGDTVLVHSSMKKVGEVEGGADAVLDALMHTIGHGLLVLPTHTWATMSEEHLVYDPALEPACVGILPNLFLKRKGVCRSLHPTHSLAAWSGSDGSRAAIAGNNRTTIEGQGEQAVENLAASFVSGEEVFSTPCDRKGCYGKLYDRDAKILLMGVELNKNTYMHGIEEWFGIKERLTDTLLPLEVVMPDGSRKKVPMRKHYKPDGKSIAENYMRMKEIFLERGAMEVGMIGDAQSYILSARKITEICNEYLKQNRDYFQYESEIVK